VLVHAVYNSVEIRILVAFGKFSNLMLSHIVPKATAVEANTLDVIATHHHHGHATQGTSRHRLFSDFNSVNTEVRLL
jgi:hypothetical protein